MSKVRVARPPSFDGPGEAPWQVKRPRSASYYEATQWVHRVRAERARRSHHGRIARPNGVRILCYHRVSAERDELAVSPAIFRAQMETLLETCIPVGLDTAVGVIRDGLPGQHVCVTFDDGYHDNLDHAIPVLRSLGIPATFFVPTAVVDGTANFYWYRRQPAVLDWSQLRDISREALFSIGAHSRTHPSLPALSDEDAWVEIAGSKRDVDMQMEKPTIAFAYPAGLYGERELRMVRDAGYLIGLTCRPGLNTPTVAFEALRRTLITRRDTLYDFKAKLDGLLDTPWALRDALPFLRRRAPRASDA